MNDSELQKRVEKLETELKDHRKVWHYVLKRLVDIEDMLPPTEEATVEEANQVLTFLEGLENG